MFILLLKVFLCFCLPLSVVDSSQQLADQSKKNCIVFSEITNNNPSDSPFLGFETNEIEENNSNESNFNNNNKQILSFNYLYLYVNKSFLSSVILNHFCFYRNQIYLFYKKIII